MRSYCSIFDKNYLFQGLAVFKSLEYSSEPFIFYPLCMDEESYGLLIKMNLKNMLPIKLDQVMTEELSEIQVHTTKGQFCWVCQPVICQYILEKLNAEIVIYLEADSLFFADPEILLAELGNDSVSLVPHNFSPEFDNTKVAGKFCVQFNAFRNDDNANKVLEYWKMNCFKYTSQNLVVYPGQTCLDNWINLFNGVRSLENKGAGVAPWNVNRYNVSLKNNQVFVDDRPIIFYHFHEYGRYSDGRYELGNYPFSKQAIKLIYRKYINVIHDVESLVKNIDPHFNYRRNFTESSPIRNFTKKHIKIAVYSYIAKIKRIIKGRYNVFPPEYFN